MTSTAQLDQIPQGTTNGGCGSLSTIWRENTCQEELVMSQLSPVCGRQLCVFTPWEVLIFPFWKTFIIRWNKNLWWFEWEPTPIVSYIWILGPQLVELFKKDSEAWPCWWRYVTRFKTIPIYLHLLLMLQHHSCFSAVMVPTNSNPAKL